MLSEAFFAIHDSNGISSVMENVEIWRAIPGWEGLYEASSLGRIRSLDRKVGSPDRRSGVRTYKGKVICPSSDGMGYTSFCAASGGVLTRIKTHRAVCAAFHGAPEAGMDARHLNGDKNYNRPENLAWGTRKENEADKASHGTWRSGVRLSVETIKSIKEASAAGVGYLGIASAFNISKTCAYMVVSGKRHAGIS